MVRGSNFENIAPISKAILLLSVSLALVLIIFFSSWVGQDYLDGNFGCGVTDEYQFGCGTVMLEPKIEHIGKEIFEGWCMQCHSTDTQIMVGPGLEGITSRKDEKWIKMMIKDEEKLRLSGDKYAQELFIKFGEMPHFKVNDSITSHVYEYLRLLDSAKVNQ